VCGLAVNAALLSWADPPHPAVPVTTSTATARTVHERRDGRVVAVGGRGFMSGCIPEKKSAKLEVTGRLPRFGTNAILC